MQIDIYIRERNGNREIQVPWLPEKIHFKSGGVTMATYEILDRGEVAVPTGSGLAAYSWESLFPGENRKVSSMQRGTWQAPKHYHNILEDWKKNGTPLHLLVIGYPVNVDVLLEDYEGDLTGGFGDIEYSLSFIEDRDLTVTSTEVPTPQRQTSQNSNGTYTIKSGDTLWGIAERFYKSGAKWKTIYDANKDIIEKTAKKYGKSSSNNGWWIYPGVKLTIP